MIIRPSPGLKEPANQIREVQVLPGTFYFGGPDVRIHSLLGSCIAMSAWHPTLHIGGLGHFMLAAPEGQSVPPVIARPCFELIAMFISEMRAAGTEPRDYEIRLFGGGRTTSQLGGLSGQQAVELFGLEAAKRSIEESGFQIVSADLGLPVNRRILFDLWSGNAWARRTSALIGESEDPDPMDDPVWRRAA